MENLEKSLQDKEVKKILDKIKSPEITHTELVRLIAQLKERNKEILDGAQKRV